MTRSPLVAALTTAGLAVETSGHRIAAYAYDASNYRIPPIGVVFPRTADEVATAIRICRTCDTPLVGRGGGTSMAGNAIGPGIVLDFSRYLTRVHAIDEARGVADVDAGVVLSELARAAEQATSARLTFAPDPSSKTRATVGGAIGNDACGNHSVRHGRTSDHVLELDIVTWDGARLTAHHGGLRATDPEDNFALKRAGEIEEQLKSLVRANLAPFRTELGRIPRQVSGYHLGHLLPENGFNVARALVGSEGTCVIVLRARVKLVPKAPSALLVCLGYADVVEAARDIPTILAFSPAAVEGIDHSIVETMRLRRGDEAVGNLPAGKAFLYVDLDGGHPDEVDATAGQLLERLRLNGRLVEGRAIADSNERAALWRVREDGAALSYRPASGGESWPGWEDSAVAPEKLADYLADFRELLREHQLTGVMYGHFGAGCMHIRVTYDLRTERGRTTYREFVVAAAKLVVRHEGSLSGEHGDGRARSELLGTMYTPTMLAAFDEFRRIWDHSGMLNPGSITAPDPIDENLALAGVPRHDWRTSFTLSPIAAAKADVDPWTHAVQGCIGVGRCRAPTGGVMCPSFRATGDETDSTRGRARMLQEMIRNTASTREGWASEDVREALDLCLSCKACSYDCPAGVDMATYKSEFFSHYYRWRRRPMSHYSMGWLPAWLKITAHVGGLVNPLLAGPRSAMIARIGGLTTRRALPRLASRNDLRRELASIDTVREQANVVLFVDSFTKGFRPRVAGAAARVAADTGRRVACEHDACCGLTWISTGQLKKAKKVMARAVRKLDDGTETPIVVIEPSCAAALKKDLPELLDSPGAERVSKRIRSFAEAVTEWVAEGWRPPPTPTGVTLQTHCHEYSTFGAATQRRALASLGIARVLEATGCCGVAGNFGFEPEHYEVSMRVAEQSLKPALAQTPAHTPVLTDGFSCHMQVRHIEPDRPSLHLAELIDPANSGVVK